MAHHIGVMELIDSILFKEVIDLNVFVADELQNLTPEYHANILKTEYPLEWNTYNLLKSLHPEKSAKELVKSLTGLAQTHNIVNEPLPELEIY